MQPCGPQRVENWFPGDAIIPHKPKKRRARPAIRVQYGALPYRFTHMAALEILDRHDATNAAVDRTEGLADQTIHAFEVGCARGVRGSRREGEDRREAIGNFRYKKARLQPQPDADCEVKVFPLLVKRQSATWPEYGQRMVQWVDPEKAISLIREPELKSIVAKFAKRAAAAACKLNLLTDRRGRAVDRTRSAYPGACGIRRARWRQRTRPPMARRETGVLPGPVDTRDWNEQATLFGSNR